MNGNWNKRYVDNSISSSIELEESKYENPSNTATDSFFKAYEVRDIEKQSQTKHKYSNTSNSINELPNKRRCKAEKFEAIQYSLGPNEEYIAIRRIFTTKFLGDSLFSIRNRTLFFVKIIRSIRHMAPLLPREQRHPFLRLWIFKGCPSFIRDGLFARIVMEHRDDAGVVVFASRAWERLFDTRGLLLGGDRRRLSWRQFIMALGLHIEEEMESPGFARRFATGRKSGAYISRGQFMGRLAQHFGLLTAEILRGLTVIALELPIIDTTELDAPIVDEGGQADLTPTQAPPLLPADARTMPQRMARLEEDVYEIRGTACVTYVIYFETPREYTRHVRCMTDGASTSTAQQGPQQPDP
ncbi:hypothetical protein Tco_0129435 [Tanacetum coccineum]